MDWTKITVLKTIAFQTFMCIILAPNELLG